MKKIFLVFSFIVVFILSACAVQEVQPPVFVEPTQVIVLPEAAPVQQNTAAIIPATPDNPSSELASIQVGRIYSSFMLTYDVNIWNPVAHSNGVNNLERINATDCTLGENAGMGAPETWTRDTSQESIGTYDFRVEKWTDTATGNIVLITYNSDSNNLFIAIIPGSDTATCMDAAREVIEYSASNAFGPIQ